MKHIVIFQGKKYISSKRASKISRYSSDYIGQLCRAQKLDSRMLGHTWFVAEDSLIAYKEKVSDEALRTMGEVEQVSSLSNANTDRLSTRQASTISGYSSDYIGQLCRSGKLDCRMVGNTWYITPESLKSHQIKILSEKVQSLNEHKAEKKVVQAPKPTSNTNFSKQNNRRSVQSSLLAKMIGLGVAAAFFLAVVSGSVALIDPSQNVSGNDSSASALDAVKKVFSYMGGAYEMIASIFNQNNSTESVHMVSIDEQLSRGLGVAITPSTGSAQKDDLVKQQIQNSFSDQVSVHPDQSGGAGVITPVFKESTGKNFVYVLVPVSNTTKSPP